MAQQPKRFRHYSVFYRNRKVAEISGNEYTITSNDEAQIGDEGYMGHSDGATMTRLAADAVVPVEGLSVDVLGDMIRKRYVEIAKGVLMGKIHRTTMRCTEATISGSAQNGTQTARFNFEGGQPNIT